MHREVDHVQLPSRSGYVGIFGQGRQLWLEGQVWVTRVESESLVKWKL